MRVNPKKIKGKKILSAEISNIKIKKKTIKLTKEK